MPKFTKRSLCAAIASMGALGAIDAHAVNVSADGRGQVLLYPYYAARTDSAGNPYGTLLSVINATGSAKAVRVRFLEGKNGREVLDFNLFLSPFDVWAGVILPDIATGGAKIGSTDVSCTLPAFSDSPNAPYVSFANDGYSGTNDDGAGTGLDRTKEGYFEIIEMAAYTSSSTTGMAITHNTSPGAQTSVPPCGVNLNDTQAAADAQPATGGLFGGITLINVASGTDYTADAIALANFYQIGSNYQPAGTILPDLTQATPPVSRMQAPNGAFYESTWSTGSADPVSALLMHDSLMNEFVLDTATKSGTDWVVTLPTKRYYVNSGTDNAPYLFQHNFNGITGSCDDISFYKKLWDREERRPAVCGDPGDLCLLPLPPQQVASICSTTNVIRLGNSNVLGSTNASSIDAPYQNGWLAFSFLTDIPAPPPTFTA